ncbi:hypothetical protein FACS1894172_01920 [Spirochaetia bacterium]|nr:hypothetical protein FACS1894172_01920 [Spirochaetia bacterium]
MSDYDIEDISELEDNPELVQESDIVATEVGIDSGTPLYRIRLLYSYETFLAVYPAETLKNNSFVLIPTRYGQDLAQVIGMLQSAESQILSDIVQIIRIAGPEDLTQAAANDKLEREAFDICKEKIEQHHLEMKLVSVHYLLDEPKILFFFVADSRIDFRELVKDLVSVFRTRIELRQIGIRDEARILGGIGVCGRCYCCRSISDQLRPVSIKMAKDQNLSLNSMKISGPCGRLLCCLEYEHAFYTEQRKNIPAEGSRVHYLGAFWKVVEINVVAGSITIVCDDGRQMAVPASAFEKKDGFWQIEEKGRKPDSTRQK